MNKRVGIIRCGDYDPERVYQALKNAVDLAGADAVIIPSIINGILNFLFLDM